MPRWRTGAGVYEGDWLLTVSFNVNDGVAKLRRYRDYLRKSATGIKDKRKKKWLVREQKMATKLAANLLKVKTKGIAHDVLKLAGNRLHRQVLAAWRAEMTPRTYSYLNSIIMSPIAKTGDGRLFIGVGSWKYMMRETSLEHNQIKHMAVESWVKPKYGSKRPTYVDDPDLISEQDRKAKAKMKGQYIASRGPLTGHPITGYWYFQEAGFTHFLTKQFIHHPVFSSIDMNPIGDQMVKDFDRKIHQFFGNTKRYVTWTMNIM